MESTRPCRTVRTFLLSLLGFLAVASAVSASASPSPGRLGLLREAPRLQPTPFLTPTAGPDGWIVYIVQPGDTLWDIAAIAGITLEELMALNGIQPGDYISPNMRLRLGQAGPVVATPELGAEPTATPVPPSPTPMYGTGQVCVLLFLDRNGDARRQEDEPPLAGGQLSVADLSGAVVGEHTTDGTTQYADDETTPIGQCFTDLQAGDYNVSAAVPPDHNSTTSMNLPVRLEPGETKYVEFGAQPSGEVGDGQGGGGRQNILGILGLVLLLSAAALGYYAARYRKKSGTYLR